jgi:hypothetical protein
MKRKQVPKNRPHGTQIAPMRLYGPFSGDLSSDFQSPVKTRKVVCIATYRRKVARWKATRQRELGKAAAEHAKRVYRETLPLVRAI